MAEENNPQAGQGELGGQESPAGTETVKVPTSAPGAQEGAGAGKVDDLPEWARGLIGELRKENASHRKAKGEAERAAQAAEEQRLADEKKWQELAERRAKELEKASKELARIQHEMLVRDVAQAAGLPVQLAARLRGETREALEADAAELKRLIPAETPGAPPGPQRGAGSQQDTEAYREQLRQRFRIN